MGYLRAVLLFGIIWLIYYLRYPRLRSCLLWSGGLFLPAGFAEALFVPAYWNPEVSVRIFGLDPESFMFAFFTGGIASVLYPALFGCSMEPASRIPGRSVRQLFWIMPAAAALFFIGIAVFTSFPVIYAAFGIFLSGIIHMLLVRPDMARVSAWGALLFAMVYSGVAVVSAVLFPQFVRTAWSAEPVFGWRICRIPFDEFVYSALFGGLWATVYCGVFNCRFVRSPGR